MEMMALPTRLISISSTDSSQTGNARRQAFALADQIGLDELQTGQLGIVVTEAARNIETHGGGGEILLTAWQFKDDSGIDLLAIDKGKGIPDIPVAMQDGYSTTATPGNGLGALSRLSEIFQIYSAAGLGTAIFSRISKSRPRPETEKEPYLLGGVSVPIAGESVCGDAWSAHFTPGRSLYLMADGLGHGAAAAEASEEAVRIFRQAIHQTPAEILGEVHDALKKTRGAAVSVAEILHDRQTVNYSGAGNIAAVICTGAKTRSLVSMNGTVGHSIGKLQQFSYPWEPGAMLVLHSDGLSTRWNIEQYPGLASRHPALVAGVLFRDFSRKRDDATILATRI